MPLDSPDQLLQTARASLASGDPAGAQTLLKQLIANNPRHGPAWLSLASAQRQLGELELALASYQTLNRLCPNIPEVLNDLGVTCMTLRQFDQAERSFRQAIVLRPDYVIAIGNLADCLMRAGRFADAAAAFQALIQLQPATSEMRSLLGTCLLRCGRPAEAAEQLSQAVAHHPQNVQGWFHLGLAFEELGRREDAIQAMQHADKLDPGSPIIAYHLAAALHSTTPPAICPPSYVVELFDDYADRFDQHLVNTLNYHGPQLMLDAVKGTRPEATSLEIIDLGCGTGLCGLHFAKLTRRLVGVDLAPRMIEQSRQRAVYDQLIQTDVITALANHPSSFDLALAGDLFIYIGNLDPVFSACRNALRPFGLFVFTIETSESADYVLRVTRRYAHSTSYIHRLAASHQFDILLERPAILRLDEAGPVSGVVFVLQSRG